MTPSKLETIRKYWAGFLFGAVISGLFIIANVAIIGPAVWEHGKWYGAKHRIPVQHEMNLRACSTILQTEDTLDTSQIAACGRVIETLFEKNEDD